MDFFKNMRTRTGLLMVAGGLAVGVLLRLVLMLRCFDFDTGFYTDGGVAAWLGLLLPLLMAGTGVWAFFRCRRAYTQYSRGRDALSGAFAALSGLVLLYTALVLTQDYRLFLRTGISAFETVQQERIHQFFLLMCWLFGAVQLVAGVGFFTGRDLFGRLPLLYVPAVLWGVAYLVIIYIFYTRYSSFVENFFAVAGGGALLLALFYLCRLFAGVGEQGAALRLLASGSAAAVLVAPYHMVNLAAGLAGKTFDGEMPPQYALCGLSVALFVLAFLVGYSRSGVDPEQELADPKHF